MSACLEFIAKNPGCTRTEVFDATGVIRKPWGSNPNSIERLIRRGLVTDLGRCNRSRLFAVDMSDRPAELHAHP